ncbi:MAG: glycoside hydrolase family 127 protein, partial [Draconibacterium sp.]|nr:glycoside hydrolase family 127 protein [Draconibacterium sp.]
HTWFPKTDSYKWAKGYEFTSCVEGLAELYKVTGTEDYLKAAENIHQALVDFERTPVGSLSFNDKLIGSKGLINTISEICDVVYWNRLSFILFSITGESKYVEEMERALYNSLLFAFNKEGTWSLRRLRTSHMHIPATNHFLQHHQCCTDNLPRGLFQAADFALMKRNDNKIYLSLFNKGEGKILLKNKSVRIKIDGDFLSESKIETTISLKNSLYFQLYIRVPDWSNKTSFKINGEKYSGQIVDNWMIIDREWHDGDRIEIVFDIELRWETFNPELFDSTYHKIDFYNNVWAKMKFETGSNETNNSKYKHVVALKKSEALIQQKALAFFYGPIVLARDIRVSGEDIFFPIFMSDKKEFQSVKLIKSNGVIWKKFEVNLGNEQIIRFCDFSSAGNTWDKNSLFNTWCILRE